MAQRICLHRSWCDCCISRRPASHAGTILPTLHFIPTAGTAPRKRLRAPRYDPSKDYGLLRARPPFGCSEGVSLSAEPARAASLEPTLIPACHDYGIPEVRAAGLLAMMGVFDIVGTTFSGWLSDRLSRRYLLSAYYVLRGISLLFLPHTLAHSQADLNWFAVFYGLDWVATVPPTVKLTSDCFGRDNAGVIYGWVVAAHQLGAALAASGAGLIRTQAGDYQGAFWIAGTLCSLTGVAFLFLQKPLRMGHIGTEVSTGPHLEVSNVEA